MVNSQPRGKSWSLRAGWHHGMIRTLFSMKVASMADACNAQGASALADTTPTGTATTGRLPAPDRREG